MSVTSPDRRWFTWRGPARATLGLFVVVQLIYLAAANSLAILQSHQPDLAESGPARAVGAVTQRWSDLTGQEQNWSLFAPIVGRDATFPAVELRWAGEQEDPILVLSDNEPRDPHGFLRLGRFRLRRCEAKLVFDPPAPGELAVTRDGWNRHIDTKVRVEWRRVQAYLRWRMSQFDDAKGDMLPPAEAVLVLRRYRIPSPDRSPWDWEGPESFPVARYTVVGVPLGADYLPLERYNPVVDRFEMMRRGR